MLTVIKAQKLIEKHKTAIGKFMEEVAVIEEELGIVVSTIPRMTVNASLQTAAIQQQGRRCRPRADPAGVNFLRAERESNTDFLDTEKELPAEPGKDGDISIHQKEQLTTPENSSKGNTKNNDKDEDEGEGIKDAKDDKEEINENVIENTPENTNKDKSYPGGTAAVEVDNTETTGAEVKAATIAATKAKIVLTSPYRRARFKGPGELEAMLRLKCVCISGKETYEDYL